MTDQPKPPGPSGTPPQDFTYDQTRQPCWVCGKRAFWGARFGWLCGEHAQAANDSVAADAADPASPDASMPVGINSRADVVATVTASGGFGRLPDGTIGHVPADPNPAPWWWRADDSELVDAKEMPVLTSDDAFPPVVASPRVRELLRAAPEMEALLRGLTDPSRQAEHGVLTGAAWKLLDRIDRASK